jgi:hypothetical protein
MGVAGASFRSANTCSILGRDTTFVDAFIQKKFSSGGEVLLKSRCFTDN